MDMYVVENYILSNTIITSYTSKNSQLLVVYLAKTA